MYAVDLSSFNKPVLGTMLRGVTGGIDRAPNLTFISARICIARYDSTCCMYAHAFRCKGCAVSLSDRQGLNKRIPLHSFSKVRSLVGDYSMHYVELYRRKKESFRASKVVDPKACRSWDSFVWSAQRSLLALDSCQVFCGITYSSLIHLEHEIESIFAGSL